VDQGEELPEEDAQVVGFGLSATVDRGDDALEELS
jgi:hypothetical protein